MLFVQMDLRQAGNQDTSLGLGLRQAPCTLFCPGWNRRLDVVCPQMRASAIGTWHYLCHGYVGNSHAQKIMNLPALFLGNVSNSSASIPQIGAIFQGK